MKTPIEKAADRHIPALKYHFLTRFYDVGIRLTLPERRMKGQLLRDALTSSAARVLDLGCGTGTLLMMGSERESCSRFHGVDPDVPILSTARNKIRQAGAAASLQAGSATALPYRDGSFDAIASTLVIHHLTFDQKREAFREVHRVLRAGGAFHLLDFGAPSGPLARVLSFLVEVIGREHVRENFGGMIPGLVSDAGFESVVETARFNTVFGTIRLICARKRAQ